MSLPPPKPKAKLELIPRREVRKLAARVSCDSDHSMLALFPPDSPARKRLHGRKRDVYIRAVVLEVLGINDD